MPYAAVNDLRLYYEEQGQGEPLVLLHGATGALAFHATGWGDLAPAFAERYRAIQIEHRGHGHTDNPTGRLAYAQMAADIAAFIEHLDLGPAHVAGVSDGGVIGLELGMTRPDLLRSLVCVGARYRVDEQLRAGLADFDAEMIERNDPGFAAAYAGWHDPHHHLGYWRELMVQLRAMMEVEPDYSEDDLRRIPVPTLLIVGEADRYVSLDQVLTMRRVIPNAELLVLNHAGMVGGAGHLVQFSRADVVGPIVLDFLSRHAGPAAAAADA